MKFLLSNAFTFILVFIALVILLSFYFEEELLTDCARKIIVINEDREDISSLKCINNNIIVQRRMRRELEDGKREKDILMRKMLNRNKINHESRVEEIENEKNIEFNKVAKKGLLDIRFKLKTGYKPKDNNSEALYARGVFKAMHANKHNFTSNDFQTIIDYLTYLLN